MFALARKAIGSICLEINLEPLKTFVMHDIDSISRTINSRGFEFPFLFYLFPGFYASTSALNCSGVSAPVMTATTSDMPMFFGLTTAARRPRR